jgi:hypothetical protein
LYDDLGMKKFNLRWVSHALDANQQAEQVVLSHELLAVRETSRPMDSNNMRSGDPGT